MLIVARDGTYKLTWTGRKWIDKSGSQWEEIGPGRGWDASYAARTGFDFRHPKHGEARIIDDRRTFSMSEDSIPIGMPQHVRIGKTVYDTGSMWETRRRK